MGQTVLIVGAGRFGALHARVWREAGAEIVGVADVRLAAAEALAARCEAERGRRVSHATDAAALVNALAPDIVVVASTEDTHEEMASLALRHGAHVLVEKPFAMSSVGARRISQAADEAARRVLPGHLSRFTPSMRRLSDLLRNGDLGELWTMRFRRDFSRSWFADFGDRVHPAWESAIHDIDLAVSFAGVPARRVYAHSSSAAGAAAPSVVSALIEFRNGVTATVETAWTLPWSAPANVAGALDLEGSIVSEAEIHGSSGVARMHLPHDGLVLWGQTGTTAPDLELWPELDGRVAGAMRAQVEHALEFFSGGSSGETLLEQAVWGIEIAEALVGSLRSGVPVQIDEDVH